MKKKIISKALCVALASVLIFGEAVPAMAAADGSEQGQAVVAEDTVSASIDTISVGDSDVITNSYVQISASGSGTRATLYINDVEYDSYEAYYGRWNISTSFSGKAGATYEFKVVAEGSDGPNQISTLTRKFEAPVFNRNYVSAWWNTETSDSGYTKYKSAYVKASFESRISAGYDYYVYRSTNPKTGFKKIYSNSISYGGDNCWMYDESAVCDKTYYYQMKVVAAKDNYIKAEKVIATSPVIKVSAVKQNDIYANVKLAPKGVALTISNPGYYNQFDIYRSASKNSGYKKIRTITGSAYTDTTVKAGKIYYYKIAPKYYEPKTGKLVSGKTTSAFGVKVTMGTPEPYAEKISMSSVRLTWDKVRGANVYEVWYRQSDITGNSYSRLAVTKGNAYTVKGLKSGHSYDFLVKAQNVSKGKIICENQSNAESMDMGYDDAVYFLKATNRSSAISSDKKTLTIYTTLAWEKVPGASGYIITAYNRLTGKVQRIAKLTSWTKNTYKFKNVGTSAKGMKYTYVSVSPYRGSVVGSKNNEVYVNSLPVASGVKVARKNNSSAVVSWKAVAGASSYIVYRQNKQSGFTQWRGSSSGTSYEDNGYSVRTDYEYYVLAQSAFEGEWSSGYDTFTGNSKYSAKYQHKLGTPKIKRVSNTAAGQITVTWNSVDGADRYVVYRATSKTGKYTRVASVKTASYVDKKAAKGSTYYYKVISVAVSGAGLTGQSGYSAAVGAKSAK